MTRSRRALAAVLGTALLLAGISFANAASLLVDGGSVGVVAGAHPCSGTASAVVVNSQGGTDYLGVVLALPPGCGTKPVQLHVDRPNNNPDRDGSGTTDAAGVVSIRLNGTFRTSQTNTFSATVDGWALPIAWNTTLLPPIWCTVMDSSTATCAATVTIFTGTKPGGTSSATYYEVVVTTTSASNVLWEVGFYLDHAYYGSRATRLGNSTLDTYDDGTTAWNGTTNGVTRQSACSAIPVLLVRGNNTGGGNNFQNVLNSRPRQFSLVINRTETGYSDVISPTCV